MADRKITDLTALAAGDQATGDLLTIVDVSEGAATDKNKKITVESLFKGIPGNVGIGTSSPSSALDVQGSGASIQVAASGQTNARVRIVGGNTSSSFLEFGDSDDSDVGEIVYDHSNNSMRFNTNASERMRIDSDGRLLVGATSNSSNAAVQGFKAHGSTGNESGFTSIDTTAMAAGVGGEISFMGNTTTAGEYNYLGHIRGIKENATSGNTACALTFHTRPTATAPQERMRIDSSGRLLQGKTATKGSTGENIPTYCTEVASNNPNVLEIANNGTGSGSYSALVLSRSDSTSVNGHTAVDNGDKIGEVAFIGADGSDRFNTGAAIAAIAQADFSANDCPTHLTFSTNGGSATASERMRIDSDGRLLVGTSSAPPANTADVVVKGGTGSGGAGGITITRTNTTPADGNSLGNVHFADSSADPAATIQAQRDGGTWTSTSSQPSRLVFQTTTDGASSTAEACRITSQRHLRFADASADPAGGSNIWQKSGLGLALGGGNIAFYIGTSEKARLDSSGRFLHGLTTPSASSLKFEVAANVGPDPAFRFNQTATSGLTYDMFFTKTGYAPDNTSSRFLTCSDTSADRLIIRSDGDVVNHDNSYGAISDVSKKQQIVDAASQWDDIKAVRVRKFKMNSDVEAYGDEAGFRIGVVAQEIEQTSPGLVKNGAELDGTAVKTVSYSVLYMKAIKALQEAQTRIETLESQHADLLARVAALEAQ